VELRGKREELHLLRQNELNMELKVEAGHNHLVQLMKFLRTNQADLDEVLIKKFVQSVSGRDRTVVVVVVKLSCTVYINAQR